MYNSWKTVRNIVSFQDFIFLSNTFIDYNYLKQNE